MSDAGSFPSVAQLERELAAELLRIHKESYGKGAAEARAHILDDLVVCMLDEIEMLPAEQFLIDSGEGQGVIEVRSRYQAAIETTFRAAVERGTGRRVISFASVTKLDPNYVIETFRLAPAEGASTDGPV
jgi:uncharacterized protein YbcI